MATVVATRRRRANYGEMRRHPQNRNNVSQRRQRGTEPRHKSVDVNEASSVKAKANSITEGLDIMQLNKIL